MAREAFTQVGQTALRDPATGDYLPAVPLYVRAADIGGANAAYEPAARDIGRLFAKNIKTYIDGGGLDGAAAGMGAAT